MYLVKIIEYLKYPYNSEYALLLLANEEFLMGYIHLPIIKDDYLFAQMIGNKQNKLYDRILRQFSPIKKQDEEWYVVPFKKLSPYNDEEKKYSFKLAIQKIVNYTLKLPVKNLTIAYIKYIAKQKQLQAKKDAEIKLIKQYNKQNLAAAIAEKLNMSITYSIKHYTYSNRKYRQSKQLKIDASVEQTMEDLLKQLYACYDIRNKLKMYRFIQEEKGDSKYLELIYYKWVSNYKFMKELLDSLLEKINREMGLSLVFASLKASCQEILPQLSMKSSPQKQKSVKGGKTPLKKSPAKTATTSNTSSPSKSELRQMKIVERFQHWFNCLFLDYRYLSLIAEDLALRK